MFVFKKNPYMYQSGSEKLKNVISLSQTSNTIKKKKHSSGTIKIGFNHEDIKWEKIQVEKNSSKTIFHRFYYRWNFIFDLIVT